MTGVKTRWDTEDEEGLPRAVMGSGCWLRWGHSWDFAISACTCTQPLGAGFEVSACLLTLSIPSRREPCHPQRSRSTRMGTGALLTPVSPKKSCSRSCKSGTSSRPTCSWCRRNWPITRGELCPRSQPWPIRGCSHHSQGRIFPRLLVNQLAAFCQGAAERGENSQLLLGRNEVKYQKTEEKNQSQNAGNGGGVGEQVSQAGCWDPRVQDGCWLACSSVSMCVMPWKGTSPSPELPPPSGDQRFGVSG